MKNKSYRKLILLISIILPLIKYFPYSFTMHNPFPEVDWIKDYPGATERYIEFTPVLKADKRIKLGPAVGADYGKLQFKDINNDGIKEAIIETELLVDWGEFYDPERHVLQYQKTVTGHPQFFLIKSEKQSGNN